jgi:glutamate racemase
VSYGSRTRDEIARMTRQCVDFLATKDIDILIIACNTATAAALDELSGAYPFPVIGVISAGVEAATATTRNGKVGVIATQFTIESEAHKKAIRQVNPEIFVIGKACPSFCPLVEAGKAESPEMDRDAKDYLSVFKGSGIDTLVLACTHYPLIVDTIRRHVPEGVTFVDPAVETVKQAIEILTGGGFNIRSGETGLPEVAPTYHFYTSGDPVHFEKLGSQFFGAPTGEVRQVRFE